MTIYVALALIGFIAALAYLADFRWASRRDPLFVSPGCAARRRARRAAGLHVNREIDRPSRSQSHSQPWLRDIAHV